MGRVKKYSVNPASQQVATIHRQKYAKRLGSGFVGSGEE
jgi:hypothetical protein